MVCLTKRHACVYLLFFITHGSDVLGDDVQNCIDDVYKLFKIEDDPEKHFTTAFTDYNLKQFENNDPSSNTSALGYFKDLINCVVDINDFVFSPSEFCSPYVSTNDKTLCTEAMYMFFANKTLNPEAEVGRIMRMKSTEAFRHIYLNYIRDYVRFEKVYPQERELTLNDLGGNRFYYEEARRQKKQEDTKKQNIIKKMRVYFTYLFEEAKIFSRYLGFRDVDEYCDWLHNDDTTDSDE